MFILFHKRVCRPLANSLFHHRPDEALKPASKVETAYHKADHAIQQILQLLALEDFSEINSQIGCARN
jgi:hypothetical protein